VLFSSFEYAGTHFAFESEKKVSVSLLSISPGATFFATWPVQLQINLPMGSLDLWQSNQYRQRFGISGVEARFGRIMAPKGIVASIDYASHPVEQTVAGEPSKMNFEVMTATIGWAFGTE
jgi:hypothetical protein